MYWRLHIVNCPLNSFSPCCTLHSHCAWVTCQYMYSLCGVPVLITDVGVVRVGDGDMEGVHPPKSILAVLLSLMNVVVLTTTTVKLYLVPHWRLVKVVEFIFGLSSFINTGALLSDWCRTKVVFQHMDWSPDHCHVTVTLVELMISALTSVGAV